MSRLYLSLLILLSVFPLSGSSQSVEKIFRRLIELSGLKQTEPFSIRFTQAKEVESVILQDYLVRFTADSLRRESHLLTLIGLFEQEPDLLSQFKKIWKGNLKAYYQNVSRTLFIDESIPFEDDYSQSPVIEAIREAMVIQISSRKSPSGRLFSDQNWLDEILRQGDAAFVMHTFLGEDPEVMVSIDATSLIARNPLASAASRYRVEDLVVDYFCLPLIYGVRYCNTVFKKKGWSGLHKEWKNGKLDLKDFFNSNAKSLSKEIFLPGLPTLDGFQRCEEGKLGLMIFSRFMGVDPRAVVEEMGWQKDQYALDKVLNGTAEMVQWQILWHDHTSARSALLVLKEKYETSFKCRFREGETKGKSFLAGSDRFGAYVLLYQLQSRTFLMRTFDRKAINHFIEAGKFE